MEGLHFSEKERVRVLKEGKHAKRYTARVRIDEERSRTTPSTRP